MAFDLRPGPLPAPGANSVDADRPHQSAAEQSVMPSSADAEATNDAAWVQQAAGGNTRAVGALYQRHARTVYRFAWLLAGDESAAADVVQDTFVALLHAGEGKGACGFDAARGSVAAYLCGIARHLVYRRARDRHADFASLDADDGALLDDTAADATWPALPLEQLARRRAVNQLYAAIRTLAPHYRDVLVLVELQEMSYADAAHVAGIEIGTVRSRLARAKKQLAERLADAPLPAKGSDDEQ